MIPTTIKYCGKVYKLAAVPHKRCKPGTHWNVKTHSCEKLPPELAEQRMLAHDASVQATVASNHAYSQEGGPQAHKSHGYAASDHKDARKQHQAVSEAMSQQGFKELAIHHDELAKQHSRQQDEHDRRVGEL